MPARRRRAGHASRGVAATIATSDLQSAKDGGDAIEARARYGGEQGMRLADRARMHAVDSRTKANTTERTCVHCVIARALRSEVPKFEAVALTLRLGRLDPVWVPQPACAVYRAVRALLAEARAQAARSPVKLTLVDMAGKSHLELIVSLRTSSRAQVLTRAFPRHAAGTLERGFEEMLLSA